MTFVNGSGSEINVKGNIVVNAGINSTENKQPVIPLEKRDIISDESGFTMDLQETSFKNIDLRWGNYTNPSEKNLKIEPQKSGIVSHFRLHDPSTGSKQLGLKESQFVVYRESALPYEINIRPTKNASRRFFELIISDNTFNDLITEESPFLTTFSSYKLINTLSPQFITQMAPEMYQIINDMQRTSYTGYLKGLYLETKAIELFLNQVYQLDHKAPVKSTLSANDIDCLYDIKKYIDGNYLAPLSIIDLARKAGINQTKLKSGFKQLFNSTVFEYINNNRLLEAKRLLQEENMYVNEVAEEIGYKHPQHFTAAFKKKFGSLPRIHKIQSDF